MKIFPKQKRGDFAQAIMDLATSNCTKIKPKCFSCIIIKECNYKAPESKDIIKKKKKIKFCINYFIYDKSKKFFVRKRPLQGLLGGMYEIPSGEWSKDDWDMKSEFYLKKSKNFVTIKKVIKYQFSHFTLHNKIVLLKKEDLIKYNFKGKWVTRKSLQKLPISNLTNKIVGQSFLEISALKKFL
mgnify:FL=1